MDILYADDAVVVVVKPRGVLSEDSGEDSLPARLRPTYGTLFPVHRLDRVVGGVMVFARTKAAAAALSRAVQEGQMHKEYAAVLEGVPENPAGELRDLLFKDARQGKSFVVSTPRRGAREAVLRYETERSVSDGAHTLTRVKILLQTGRSHQIRVQFASRGTPLVGDGKYGSRIKAAGVALFAVCLGFPHPKTGKRLTFNAPPPREYPWLLTDFAKYEVERKLLIAYPDIAFLQRQTGCRTLAIRQDYLLAPKGETHRVRRVQEGECVTYVETKKHRINGMRAIEEEQRIEEAAYLALLKSRDPARRSIEKTRYTLPFAGHLLEIDIYPFWQDRAVLEVELADEGESFSLPPYVTVIADVSEDARYKNVNLALQIPNDDIFRGQGS